MSRTRRLLGSVLAGWLVALLALPAAAAGPAPARAPAPAGPRPATPVEHLVVLMQSGHSFDNYFGTYPGADGIPAGVCQPPSTTQTTDRGCVRPFRLGDRPPEDLDRGSTTFRRQYDGGKMDGFLAAYRKQGRDGSTAMGYYDGQDLPFSWNAAAAGVLFDRFFSSARSGARDNYLYWVTGGPAAGSGERVPATGYTAPTIFDRLQAAGVTWKFYVENFDPKVSFRTARGAAREGQLAKVPLLGYPRFVDDPVLAARIVDLREYYRDLAGGTLPAVSYVVTAGSSESPPGSPRAGQQLTHRMVSRLAQSSAWSSSAFLWTYDGWGGWYDHVAPPQVDRQAYGFRVPAVLLGAHARRGLVDSTTLDYTSVLRFIEDNWRVQPLSTRDARASSLAGAFDFGTPGRPAELVPAERLPAPAPGVRSAVVYLLYGTALLVGALVLVTALVPMRLSRRMRWPWRWPRQASWGRSRAAEPEAQPEPQPEPEPEGTVVP